MPADYKPTLQLPETKFPMRANLPTREAERLAHWEKEDIYGQVMAKNKKGPKFILHDGPPFTNGSVHVGTLLNKTLKDIVLRYKSMKGFLTPFIPVWDCHGLPIEHKVSKELRDEGIKDLPPLDLRKRCQAFSEKNIELMRGQFARIGILADWKSERRTMDPDYEAAELKALAAFVEQGLVYRDLKPVIWSIPCKTALAAGGGEVEYHDHVSPAIWVPFFKADDPKTAFVIWTTTPWTIPSNEAVALHPRLEYVEINAGDKKYIVADKLAQKFIDDVALVGAIHGKKKMGVTFEGTKLKHPFMPQEGRVILAEFVSAEDGTGCVHIAPGHGMDDYLAGKANGLEIYSPLDDDGRYVDDGRIPAGLVGLTTLEKNGKSPANEAVIEMLKAGGNLLGQTSFSHQYPFCWRSKTPIIFRALDQWFIGLDRNETRKKVLDAIETVKWIPEQGKNRIRGSVETRPDWCVSRQRSWGVPVPAFVDEKGRRHIDASVIRALAEKVAKHGTNIFFEWDAEKILEGVPLPAGWDPKKMRPETDTLDVWLDSAASNLAVLKGSKDLAWPADLYLEGSDQHRGWFQSSLWMSVVNTGRAPYKGVLTHGFIVDAEKEKISKSKGAKPATEMIKMYGADTLRLWVASQDYGNDVPLSEEILAHISNAYSSLRNTLRYQLANLKGFDAAKDAVSAEKMLPVDQWIVWQSALLLEKVTAAYENYDFARVYQEITRFCQVSLSSIYHDIIKDRMYTCGAKSMERLSAQTALHGVFDALVKMLAPILPFTADEAWNYRLGEADFAGGSVHLEGWPKADERLLKEREAVAKDIDKLLGLRGAVNEKLEAMRKEKIIGKSLEARVVFSGKKEALALLEAYKQDLPELYIVSEVQLILGEGELTVATDKAVGYKCPRCWRYVSKAPDALCERCEKTLKLQSNGR